MGRRAELRGLTDEEVRAWMAPRRAGWCVAIENSGIDGSVGAIVRAHNAFAGSGVQLLGRGAYNKRAAVGTHQHEPIRVLEVPEGAPLVAVEADPSLPPLPSALWPGATYVLGHDAVGLSPALATCCDARFGPPPGWSGATSPAMLAHLLMARLRAHDPATRPTPPGTVAGAPPAAGVFPGSADPWLGPHAAGPPPAAGVLPGSGISWLGPHAADLSPSLAAGVLPASGMPSSRQHTAAPTPLWREGWNQMTRAQQRAELGFDWWVGRFDWAVRRDWWVCLPDAQTPLNAVAAARNALAAGAAGVITEQDPGPERERLGEHWRVEPFAATVARARAQNRTLVALEQGGTPLAETELPARAVLVAGHEVRGLSAKHLAACAQVVSLPQWGSVNSLNVASAAGLVLDRAPGLAATGRPAQATCSVSGPKRSRSAS